MKKSPVADMLEKMQGCLEEGRASEAIDLGEKALAELKAGADEGVFPEWFHGIHHNLALAYSHCRERDPIYETEEPPNYFNDSECIFKPDPKFVVGYRSGQD